MYQKNVVLCGASAYEQKYYFNQDFDSLPESVKQELHIMCVLYTEEIGGILTLEFDDNGILQLRQKLSMLMQCMMKSAVFSESKNCRLRRENFWNLWKCIIGYFSSAKQLKTMGKMWIKGTDLWR